MVTSKLLKGRGSSVLLASALMILLFWLGFLAFEAAFLADDIACDLAPGSSVFGRASWSALPPGVTCTWTDLYTPNGVAVSHTDSPSPLRLVLTVVLIAWPLSLVAARRA